MVNPSFSKSRAPTVDKRDAGKVFTKQNFDEKFDIPEFQGTVKKVKTGRNGRKKRLADSGLKENYKNVIWGNDYVNCRFKKKFNLSSNSKPHEFLDVFMPLHPRNRHSFSSLFPSKTGKKKK